MFEDLDPGWQLESPWECLFSHENGWYGKRDLEEGCSAVQLELSMNLGLSIAFQVAVILEKECSRKFQDLSEEFLRCKCENT
ncbi:hypothetical protein FEM48_Zijuj05G0070400 [Ziziphus jujuba var. spinosa]|uniref:Uncharacterized protein n=1 Tax=Ziziphus jujuba var. spinosa TaxID=714518 RepID=A0A978VDI2_ZIZJJ|nr:hypothetical protein FEM48_Zijuj05G0070400 [Ziziphus jujuba var. spinosa]